MLAAMTAAPLRGFLFLNIAYDVIDNLDDRKIKHHLQLNVNLCTHVVKAD